MGRFDDGPGPIEYMITNLVVIKVKERVVIKGRALNDKEKSQKRMLMAHAAMRRR